MTGNLSLFDKYVGYDKSNVVFICNGKQLAIEHINSISIYTFYKSVKLTNVLHVLSLHYLHTTISNSHN